METASCTSWEVVLPIAAPGERRHCWGCRAEVYGMVSRVIGWFSALFRAAKPCAKVL